MISLFKKNAHAKARKIYEKKLLVARDAQRSGDVQTHAKLMAEAEDMWREFLASEETPEARA